MKKALAGVFAAMALVAAGMFVCEGNNLAALYAATTAMCAFIVCLEEMTK